MYAHSQLWIKNTVDLCNVYVHLNTEILNTGGPHNSLPCYSKEYLQFKGLESETLIWPHSYSNNIMFTTVKINMNQDYRSLILYQSGISSMQMNIMDFSNRPQLEMWIILKAQWVECLGLCTRLFLFIPLVLLNFSQTLPCSALQQGFPTSAILTSWGRPFFVVRLICVLWPG